jgi:hypothetical protein
MCGEVAYQTTPLLTDATQTFTTKTVVKRATVATSATATTCQLELRHRLPQGHPRLLRLQKRQPLVGHP